MARTKEPLYLKCKDVMKLMNCGATSAYQIIRNLNKELEAMGKLTMRGQVSYKYFMERYYG